MTYVLARGGPVPIRSSHPLAPADTHSSSRPRADALANHPGGNPGANLKSISHRWHPILVASVWELTKETIHLPLGCLQGGASQHAMTMGRNQKTALAIAFALLYVLLYYSRA